MAGSSDQALGDILSEKALEVQPVVDKSKKKGKSKHGKSQEPPVGREEAPSEAGLEDRLARLEASHEQAWDGLADMEETVRAMQESMVSAMEGFRKQLAEHVRNHRATNAPREEDQKALVEVRTMVENVAEKVSEFDARMIEHEALSYDFGELRTRIILLEKAVSSGASTSSQGVRPRVNVPEPKAFTGKRDAKEVDNFLWHMERTSGPWALIRMRTRSKLRPCSWLMMPCCGGVVEAQGSLAKGLWPLGMISRRRSKNNSARRAKNTWCGGSC